MSWGERLQLKTQKQNQTKIGFPNLNWNGKNMQDTKDH